MGLRLKKYLKKHPLETFLFLAFASFSSLLMWNTLKSDSHGNILIATKAWSDFSATIPLIRSFSLGFNFPPEYPLFAGGPIKYHFIFYLLVGLLEKIGLHIVLALNILSSISFLLLVASIYLIPRFIFKNKEVGIISVVIFLFNGSFGFLEFFKKYPLSVNTISDIISNTSFSSFGPYDGKVVSAFWSLNIYTNQRHLAFAYFSFLFLSFVFHYLSNRPKKFTLAKTLLLAVYIGIFPFIHLAVFGMIGVSLLIYLAIYPKIRNRVLTIGIISLCLALPQIVYMGGSQIETKLINPGYLIENLNLISFVNYWTLNLGLIIFLAPLGFFLANPHQRKFLIPFLSFFILGNILQLSPEIAANHKFFNLFLIGANFFTAFCLYKIYLKNVLGKILVVLTFPFLILTGTIDFFPIINDSYVTIEDIPNNKFTTYIAENTPKDSVFLNSSYLYNPASLAGRKIFMGWPYFAWSAGYDTDTRQKEVVELFNPTSKKQYCLLLKEKDINYLEIQDPVNLEGVTVNYAFFEKHMTIIFKDSGKNISLYSVKESCQNEAITN